jgi:hypothetical protein
MYGVRKRIYETTKKSDDHRLMLATLEQIRKESEGDSLRLEGGLNINVDMIVKAQYEREIKQTVPIMQIVLARVASAQGIDVAKFLGRLKDSWYHKVLDTEELEFEDIGKPTDDLYDFDKIARVQKQIEFNEQNAPSTTLPLEKLQTAVSVKELLLQRLSRQKEEIALAKNDSQMRVETMRTSE